MPLYRAPITSLSAFTGTITSAQMIDPYVPVDGTMNVTGSVTISSILTGLDRVVGGGAGGAVLGFGGGGGVPNLVYYTPAANTGVAASGSGTTLQVQVQGGTTDAAGAVAVRIVAQNDLVTAGAKIASFGDNAASSYSEKLAVMLDGAVVSGSYVEAKGFSSAPAAITSSGAALVGDWSLSATLTHTLTENTTLSFSNARDGQQITLVVTQHASAAKTLTFPTVKWAGGVAPVMSVGLGAIDMFTFYKVGSVYFGSFLQDMS